MKWTKKIKLLVVMLLMPMFLAVSFINAPRALASWKDQSGNLEFGGGGGALIAMGVVCVVGLVWFIFKKLKNKKTEKELNDINNSKNLGRNKSPTDKANDLNTEFATR